MGRIAQRRQFVLASLCALTASCGRLGFEPLQLGHGPDARDWDARIAGDGPGSDGSDALGTGAPCPDDRALSLPSTPVARWHLDGPLTALLTAASVSDATGNGNDATQIVDSDQTLAHAAGRFEQGARFDGVDDYVVVDGAGSKLDLGAAGLSVTTWIRVTEPCTDTCTFIGNNFNVYGCDQVVLSLQGDKILFHLCKSQVERFDLYSASTAVADGSWHHVAATWNSPDAVIYFDGQEVARQQFPGVSAGHNLNALLLGTYHQTPCCVWEWFSGYLDEVALWATALAPQAIQMLAAQPACP
jgi:hypothetical protein